MFGDALPCLAKIVFLLGSGSQTLTASESSGGAELVKIQTAGATPRSFQFGRLAGSLECAFLTHSQMTLMLLVQGPHFEEHCSRESSSPSAPQSS